MARMGPGAQGKGRKDLGPTQEKTHQQPWQDNATARQVFCPSLDSLERQKQIPWGCELSDTPSSRRTAAAPARDPLGPSTLSRAQHCTPNTHMSVYTCAHAHVHLWTTSKPLKMPGPGGSSPRAWHRGTCVPTQPQCGPRALSENEHRP